MSLPDDLSNFDEPLPEMDLSAAGSGWNPSTPQPVGPKPTSNEPSKAESAKTKTADTKPKPGPVGVEQPKSAAESQSVAESQNVAEPVRSRRRWTAMPAWLISMFLHTGLLLILGAISLDPVQEALAVLVMNGTATEEGSDMQAFDVEAAAAPAMSESESDSEMMPDASPSLSVATDIATDANLDVTIGTSMNVASMPNLSEQLTPSEMMTASVSGSLTKSLNSRVGTARREMLEKFGGNKDSEKSVALALQWLAQHQLPDGGWAFGHTVVCKGKCDHPGTEDGRNGATGLALMTFLGAGQTHLEGEYKQTVKAGLNFLMQTMDVKGGELPTGSWYSDKGDSLYGHGIASIAMCEAYAMTHDPALAKPAQLSINFITFSQSPNTGGWNYGPRANTADTSIVGWQLMALKSGAMGGLAVDTPTLRKASVFLDNVQMNKGAFYGYRAPDSNINARMATSACGLLCRMYMGWPKDHPALEEGITYIAKKGPHPTNAYLNYYATQVLKQYGGKLWDDWNVKMRDQLIQTQEKSGHGAGSWYFDDTSPGNPGRVGGRLYHTTMCAMILEVYYRYMPIYAEQTEDVFKL